jgi:lysozyme
MSLLEKLKEQLRVDEGLRLEVYPCSTGHRTIGYGHMEERIPIDTVWTLEQAEQALDRDARYALSVAEQIVTPVVWYRLTDGRKVALANMAYQLGATRLSGFKRMLEAIRQERWSTAFNEALDSLWAKQTPARAWRVARALAGLA